MEEGGAEQAGGPTAAAAGATSPWSRCLLGMFLGALIPETPGETDGITSLLTLCPTITSLLTLSVPV